MIPYKYKRRRPKSITILNLQEQHNYFLIITTHKSFTFQTKPSTFTCNPTFYIEKTDISFMNALYSLEDSKRLLLFVDEILLEVYKCGSNMQCVRKYEVNLLKLQLVNDCVMHG